MFEIEHTEHVCKSVELAQVPQLGDHVYSDFDVFVEVEKIVHEDRGQIVLCGTQRLPFNRIHEEIDVLKEAGWERDSPRRYSS